MFELSATELAFESGRNPRGTISIGNHTVISSHLLRTNDLLRMPLSNFNLTFATGPLHRNRARRLSIHTLLTLSQFASSFPRHLPSTMTFTKSERFFSSSTPTLQSLPAPRKKIVSLLPTCIIGNIEYDMFPTTLTNQSLHTEIKCGCTIKSWGMYNKVARVPVFSVCHVKVHTKIVALSNVTILKAHFVQACTVSLCPKCCMLAQAASKL